MKAVEFNNLERQDFIKLTKKELKELVSQQAKQANKRLDRIKSNPLVSHAAVNQVMRSGGRFGVGKAKTHEDLIKEAKRIQGFNKSPTGSVKGAKQVGREVLESTGREIPTKTKQKKQRKKQKSLSDIKKDIRAKEKKIEKEKGKEAAQKYRRRAEGKYKSIQKKRKQQREAKREETDKTKPLKSSENNKESTVSEKPIVKETEPLTRQEMENLISVYDETVEEVEALEAGALSSADGTTQEQFLIEQEKQVKQSQSFMKEAVFEEWSDVFI